MIDYISQTSRALDKEPENIAFLAHFPEAVLEKKLMLIRRQAGFAENNKRTDALQLLKIWEKQILDARILKSECQIADNPRLEMDYSLPEIESYEMIEKRQELLRQRLLKEKFPEIESRHKPESHQTNLF